MVEKKIVPFEKICRDLARFKKQGKKTVLCHGIFYSLHVGHMRYLKQAKNCGDIVVVSIVGDKYFKNGGDELQYDERLRAEAVASLGWIDAVIINPYSDIVQLIERLRPDVYVKGFESAENGEQARNRSEHEIESMRQLGVELITVKENSFTSTAQINRNLAAFPEEIQKYVQLFKQRYSLEEVLAAIEAMEPLKVLVVGDTILDEYRYCTAIGKSSKDPTLVLKYESKDLFAGGVLAVANHIANFVKKVDLVTTLGEIDTQEEFIRSKLERNIDPQFILRPHAPTLVKQRLIDGYSMNKLIEVYLMDDSNLGEDQERLFYNTVRAKGKECDLVVVADFGHGTISPRIKEMLSRQAVFLAVNAQSNAGNRGFNNITKYRRANYVSIAEHEIRLELRDMTGKVLPMMKSLSRKMDCPRLAVTRGRKGCMIHDRNEGEFFQVPSFARSVVDRVGAGDSFFAMTSLAAVLNVPSEIQGFLGNVAGSIAVEIMGNEKSIDKQRVLGFIYDLLS